MGILIQLALSMPLGMVATALLILIFGVGLRLNGIMGYCIFWGWVIGILWANRLYWGHERRRASVYKGGTR